jgi:ribosomal protein L7/L12
MPTIDDELDGLKRRVARLERQVASMLGMPAPKHLGDPAPEISSEVLDLVQQGKTIDAIKMYRLETGAGLREAKEFIESLDV